MKRGFRPVPMSRRGRVSMSNAEASELARVLVIATEYVLWAEQQLNEFRHQPYDDETAWVEWATCLYSAAAALGDASMESALKYEGRRTGRRGGPQA